MDYSNCLLLRCRRHFSVRAWDREERKLLIQAIILPINHTAKINNNYNNNNTFIGTPSHTSMLRNVKKPNEEIKQQGGRPANSCPCRYLLKLKADNLALKFPINCVLK